jgi:hypothetical protein
MRLPSAVETQVVTKLYADADALGWASLTPQQHSAQYTKWVADPEIGGRLMEHMTSAAARVWIKDGPMKEWTRSISGIGKYASLVEGAGDTQTRLVRKALGNSWHVRPDSLRIKPLRIVATNGEQEVTLTWAPASGIKHMIWAALSADVAGDPSEWVLCVVGTLTRPTPANERQVHLRLADRCQLRMRHVTL